MSNVLDHAADLIEWAGWCRNVLADEAGRYCILGAIASVSDGVTVANHALVGECHERYGTHSIGTANDVHIADQAEAIEVLRAAARRLDGAS